MTRLLNSASRRTSRDTFNLRKRYLDTVVPKSKYDNFYDSSISHFYGKANFNGDIIYPSEKFLSVLPNPNKSSGKTYYALNFVARAFTDFRNYYIKGINAGIVKGDDPNIIEPTRGWESVHDLYAANINNLYFDIVNNYLQNPTEQLGIENSYPKNFDEFIKSIDNFFTIRGRDIKLSRSSFILSPNCPMSISGLAIEITPFISYNNDKTKAQDFYQDPNFQFYMEALKKFGFMADIDYPGRIIADIGSPIMQKYMSQYPTRRLPGDPSVSFDNLFDLYYYKAGDFDYELIRIYLIQFYNNYITDYPLRSVIKKNGSVSAQKYSMETNNFRTNIHGLPTATLKITCERTLREVIEKALLTQNDLNSKYDTTYWITQYAKTLNYELNNIYNANNLNKIIKNAQDINKNIDIDSAKSYINNVYKILRYPVNRSLTSTQRTEPATTTTTTSISSPVASSGGSTSGGSSYGGGSSGGSGGGGGY